MTARESSSVPHAWPVVVALGLIAVLVAGMVGIELVLTRPVTSQVDDLVEDIQQSLVLLDDLRARAQNLSEIGIRPADRTSLIAAIASDARAYAPIATSTGEAEEWQHLQDLLARLVVAPPPDQSIRDHLADQIDTSVDRLVMINAREGRARASAIRDLRAQVLEREAAIGGATLALVAGVSIVLLRVLARQRRLVVDRFRLLDERTRDLEAFAGRAAHDLRSPMSPIRGYADLLLESAGSPDEIARMARRIRTSVDRMARVVDDMLALSIAGRPSPGSALPEAVATGVLEELGPQLQGVTVTTGFAARKVACSAALLHQMLRNLIENALKFRDRTRPLQLTVEARELGAMIEIAVEDTGLGMDAETAKRALEPLYRGRTDLEVPGYGLGLAIVDRATRSLGGTCELTSALDRGTRVVLRLPRA